MRLAGAQFQLEALIGELRQSTNAAGLGIAEAGLADVAALQRSVVTAGASGLVALRLDVGTTIAAVTASAQQIRAAAGAATTAETARNLIEASTASRATVTSVMDGMHDFDSALRFTTTADAEAYRQREATRRSYIDAQQAKHTPEGDLNAAGGAIGQMVDAKAHGAGDSPEFQSRWSELVATTERLRDAVRRNGGSAKEFDDRLREDLRRILKSKGLSDTEIDAQFAAHAGDPMEAAKGVRCRKRCRVGPQNRRK